MATYARLKNRVRINCGSPDKSRLPDHVIIEQMEQSLAGLFLDLDLSDTGRRTETFITLTPRTRRTPVTGHSDLSVVQDVVWQDSSTSDRARWYDLQTVNLEEVNDAEGNGEWCCAIEGAGEELFLVLSFDPALHPVRVQIRYSGGMPEIAELQDAPRLVEAFQFLLVHETTVACLPELTKKPYATPSETASMVAFVSQKFAFHAAQADIWRERFNVFRFHTGETGPVERTGDHSIMDEGFFD